MKLSKFDEGILFACAMFNRLHDCPSMAAEVVVESGLANADVREMEDFEKEQLRIIAKEKRINFKI